MNHRELLLLITCSLLKVEVGPEEDRFEPCLDQDNACIDVAQEYFSRMRSEGFPFIVGGLGGWSCVRVACVVSSSLVVCRRLSSSLVVSRRRRVSNLLPLGEAFASDFAWMCHVSVCAAIPL